MHANITVNKTSKTLQVLTTPLNTLIVYIINTEWSLQLLSKNHIRSMLPCCGSDGNERQAMSNRIDKELKATAREHVVKLLLLRAGESGKSTFVKQMKIYTNYLKQV